MIYFFIFFNKCSFWNLLLQIKCETVLTVGENGAEKRGGGLPFLCLHCTCINEWTRQCVCVCTCVWRRMSQQPFLILNHPFLIHNHPFVSVLCMFLNWTIAGISTRGHYSAHSMAFLKGNKQNKHVIYDCCDQISAKLTQSGIETLAWLTFALKVA